MRLKQHAEVRANVAVVYVSITSRVDYSPVVPLDAGVTRATAAGHLYDAANSSHGDLVDLQQQQQQTIQSKQQVTRSTLG